MAKTPQADAGVVVDIESRHGAVDVRVTALHGFGVHLFHQGHLLFAHHLFSEIGPGRGQQSRDNKNAPENAERQPQGVVAKETLRHVDEQLREPGRHLKRTAAIQLVMGAAHKLVQNTAPSRPATDRRQPGPGLRRPRDTGTRSGPPPAPAYPRRERPSNCLQSASNSLQFAFRDSSRSDTFMAFPSRCGCERQKPCQPPVWPGFHFRYRLPWELSLPSW